MELEQALKDDEARKKAEANTLEMHKEKFAAAKELLTSSMIPVPERVARPVPPPAKLKPVVLPPTVEEQKAVEERHQAIYGEPPEFITPEEAAKLPPGAYRQPLKPKWPGDGSHPTDEQIVQRRKEALRTDIASHLLAAMCGLSADPSRLGKPSCWDWSASDIDAAVTKALEVTDGLLKAVGKS